jgi:hypothetical protein
MRRRAKQIWTTYDKNKEQDARWTAFRNTEPVGLGIPTVPSERYKWRWSRTRGETSGERSGEDRTVMGQQVTQLPDDDDDNDLVISVSCTDMLLLASWFLPFHVKASTKKVVNNSEPHDPAEVRLECWPVSQLGDGDAVWLPHTLLPKLEQPSSMHYNGRRSSSEPEVGRLTGEQKFHSRERENFFSSVTRPPTQ